VTVPVVEAEPVGWEDVSRVHSARLVECVRTGSFAVREARGLGVPWSPQLVERALRSTGGTLAAARDALDSGVGMNLGGGTHHAGHDFARGYCLVNDVVIAAARLRVEGFVRRVLVFDCDVHQGDGTADLLTADPDAFCVSLHGLKNFPFVRVPSDLDVDFESGTGDAEYLDGVALALEAVDGAGPFDLAFYLAGADPWEGDRLGRLSLSKEGLRARDRLVLSRLEMPVCVVLAGGYAEDVSDTVDINLGTLDEAKRRFLERGALQLP
jgi:acetoin utilization deacetylase AcuC-like enzyme